MDKLKCAGDSEAKGSPKGDVGKRPTRAFCFDRKHPARASGISSACGFPAASVHSPAGAGLSFHGGN